MQPAPGWAKALVQCSRHLLHGASVLKGQAVGDHGIYKVLRSAGALPGLESKLQQVFVHSETLGAMFYVQTALPPGHF